MTACGAERRKMSLHLRTELFPFRQPFHIAGYTFEASPVLLAEVSDGEHRGRGEGVGVYYLGDDIHHMLTQAEAIRPAIEDGATREELQTLLPPGGARNAIDCALWDLEAKRAGSPAWKLAGIGAPKALLTTLTIGADSATRMAHAALAIDPRALIKLKLTGDLGDDLARIAAVRTARPDAWIGVDANQGYDIRTLAELLPFLVATRIAQIEQPLPRGREAELDGLKRPLPFVADESAQSLADTPSLVGRFDVVNIKLDKCGGLTEGLAIASQARKLGLGVMVGNMIGTSLSMAPSFLLGQMCDLADLDGPTFLARDRVPGVAYRDGMIHCPDGVWGAA